MVCAWSTVPARLHAAPSAPSAWRRSETRLALLFGGAWVKVWPNLIVCGNWLASSSEAQIRSDWRGASKEAPARELLQWLSLS